MEGTVGLRGPRSTLASGLLGHSYTQLGSYDRPTRANVHLVPAHQGELEPRGCSGLAVYSGTAQQAGRDVRARREAQEVSMSEVRMPDVSLWDGPDTAKKLRLEHAWSVLWVASEGARQCM